MAGDSITAQHLHSNYFEAFCYARYPKLKFSFRNSGVGGHTIPSTLARFDYDVAAWKPTVVSVELGMNDQGGTPTDKFVANMKTMVDRIRSVNARPVILSASPINNGDRLAKLTGEGGGNNRLKQYAIALRPFCAEEKIPYADQFTRLVDVWGQNKPKENLVNALGSIRGLAGDEKLEGVEHLKAFLAAQEKVADKPVSLQGDPVHPGAPGQLMMAAALLKELGADPFVSSLTIDASGKLGEAKGCTVEGITAGMGELSFTRLDERLPFPIPDNARAVVKLDPTILELSQYTLKVTGLKAGKNTLRINGAVVGTFTDKELADGVNLTSLVSEVEQTAANPINAQAKAILQAVDQKEGLVGQFRGLSQRAHAPGAGPALKEELAALLPKVEEADAKIRAAATPQKLKFEISPQ
jgi:lysophospholipase L1-like esterase